ncbi:hypothetical protein KP509_32G017100 [Ceratopteris richardii]|uniref:Uncharacterized protein n=2 Tax=Ceratopteris richardii TaxID=49495 RepID=A0A8T2QS01_CERRI|nr:hypothetical protein KP509_32G017100 [Ceratopteris richardii]
MCIMHSSAHVCNGEYHFTGMADDNDASCIPSSFISLFWFDGSPACIAGRANHLSLSHTHTCSFTCSFRHLINSSPPNVSANIATSAEARVFSAILPEPCHLQYPSSHISVTMHFHIFPEHYKSDCPVELTVTEKALSLSGESYNITNADGEIVFKMDGHALSIRDKCVLENHHGHGILVARKKLRTMHERWEVCKGDDFDDDKLLFSVKKSSVIDFKTHLLVFLKENESEECPDFEVKGNFFDREVQIFHGDQVIAEVRTASRSCHHIPFFVGS